MLHSLIARRWVGRQTMCLDLKQLFKLVDDRGSTGDSFLLQISVVLFGFPRISSCQAARCICRVLVFDSP